MCLQLQAESSRAGESGRRAGERSQAASAGDRSELLLLHPQDRQPHRLRPELDRLRRDHGGAGEVRVAVGEEAEDQRSKDQGREGGEGRGGKGREEEREN